MNTYGKVLPLCIALLVGLSACGKRAAQTADGSGAQIEHAPATEATTPETLGEMLGSSYVETLRQVVAILEDRPSADEARASLTEIKEAKIEMLVPLGRKREAMSEEDRATVDRILNRRITMVPGDLFKQYAEARRHYQGDRTLALLIADFNIITQYANFDLLKKQLPAEAERLGL